MDWSDCGAGKPEEARQTVEFDTLITGADVIDGTGASRRPADVGIRDGRIAAMAAPGALTAATAATTIDASGQVLAPGFIDIHTHSDVTLLDNPGGESKAHQGVTTEVTGNCSYSPFPIGKPGPELMRGLMRSALDTSRPWTWTDLDGWAAVHEQAGMSINLAPLVGHSPVRFAVGLADHRPPNDNEQRHMQRLVAESVEQGAFGMSTGLTLPPSSYGNTDEIVALASAMTRYPGAFYATHARVWGGNHVGAIEEAAEIGRRAGVPVEFSHIAIIDTRAHGHPEQMTEVIDRAIAAGQDLTADVYPYTAAGTGLNQFLPEWAQEGGPDAMLARLRDPDTRTRVREDAAKGWFRGLPWDWDSLVLSDLFTDRNRHLLGKSLAQAAEERGEDPLDTFLNLIDEEDNGAGIVAHNRTDPDMRAFLSHPAIMVGSDGNAIAPDGPHGRPLKPHPRFYGTFPRILGRYVRDLPTVTLEQAVHKMTGMPARRMAMRDRGLVAEGRVADLVVFDPRTIADRATFEDPHQFPVGMNHVLVNGVPVVRDGVHTGARPGTVLRRGSA
jgi:N-acyl-D-amino-acid deacylase